jgi:hypothetical protein
MGWSMRKRNRFVFDVAPSTTTSKRKVCTNRKIVYPLFGLWEIILAVLTIITLKNTVETFACKRLLLRYRRLHAMSSLLRYRTFACKRLLLRL